MHGSELQSGEQAIDVDSEPQPTLRADIAGNRAAKKYAMRIQICRMLWWLGRFAIHFSPRPMFAWRRFVLRVFGAKIGKHVHVYPTTNIYMPWNLQVDDWGAIGEDVFVYCLGKVHIGRAAVVSYRAHICAGTHDFLDPTMPLIKPPVTICDEAWIGTDAFIGPDVTVGAGAVVGARAVVVRNVLPRHVVVGNPARTVRLR